MVKLPSPRFIVKPQMAGRSGDRRRAPAARSTVGGTNRSPMTTTDRKAWERRQRRERIVDVAETVFLEAGYEKATLPAIADAAGYNKRSLYLYFADREAIFLAVVYRCLTRLRDALRTVGDPPHSGQTGLRRLALTVFDFSVHRPADVALIMTFEDRFFIYHGRKPSPAPNTNLARCRQASEEIARIVTAAIDAGMAAGRVRNDLTARQLMLLLWGQIAGVIKILHRRERHFTAVYGIDRSVLFDRFLDMVEQALAT